MLFALYFLFAPVNLVALVRAWWKDSALRRLLPPSPALREVAQWSFALFVGGLVASVVFHQRGTVFETLLVRGPVVLWLLYAASTLAVFLLALRQGGARLLDLRGLVGVRSPLLALGPALVCVNGLSPYLGAKTETSFSMYSNLRTEGGATNHFLVRKPLRLFGYQEDLVTILESSDPKLQWYADTGHVMTWFEFREHLGRRRRIAVRFQRSGEPAQTLTRSDEDPRLVPWPSWLRKLLFFRPAKVEGPVTCEH